MTGVRILRTYEQVEDLVIDRRGAVIFSGSLLPIQRELSFLTPAILREFEIPTVFVLDSSASDLLGRIDDVLGIIALDLRPRMREILDNSHDLHNLIDTCHGTAHCRLSPKNMTALNDSLLQLQTAIAKQRAILYEELVRLSFTNKDDQRLNNRLSYWRCLGHQWKAIIDQLGNENRT